MAECLMINVSDPRFIYGKIKKKFEYQSRLRNEQTCIAFKTMLCVAAEGCNSDNLCDIFNGMLENAISPLFTRKQHKSNSKKNIKNNFPSNPWYEKECKSLKHVLKISLNIRSLTHVKVNII